MTVDCPTCGQECSTENGMKNHHAKVHGESLALVKVECEWCGKAEKEHQSQLGLFGDNWYCQRECYDNAQSKRRMGRSLEENIGEEGAKKVRSHMSKVGNQNDQSGSNNPMAGTTREHSEETKEKISESLKGRQPVEADWFFDEELGHFTRSSWERKLGRLLQDADISYEYEGESFEYRGGREYYPDFVIRESHVIIEVKGSHWVDDKAVSKAESVLDTNWEYIVIGAELPSDRHYQWENRKQMITDYETFS